MGVYHRSFYRGMSQEFLDGSDIIAAFQKVSGEAVSQRVHCDPFANPTSLCCPLDSSLEVGRVHMMPSYDFGSRILGNPSKRIPGIPNVRGNAIKELTEMGIETLLYESLGVEVHARRKRIYTVEVSGPFKGIFHGGRIGTHISEILQKLGNPYSAQFTTGGASPIKHITGQVWNWKGKEIAIYKTHPNRDHFVVFQYDIYGKVTEILERDDDIPGLRHLL